MSNQTVHFKNIREKIIETLETANTEVLIAVAWFTDEKIIKVLNDLSQKGIRISILFYEDRINNKDLFKTLYYRKAELKVSKKLMHNKFCIIDREIVINGSYNWTYNASTNDENIQITKNNYDLVNSFVEQFHKLKENSKNFDNHFNYSVDRISNLIADFEYDYKVNFESFKTPYFYKFENIEIHQIHGNKYKVKEGVVIIKNRLQEHDFFMLLYFLEKDIPIIEINRVARVEVNFPKIFDSIIGLDFVKAHNLKADKYILKSNKSHLVIEIDTRRKGSYVYNLTIVDSYGDVLNEYLYCAIMGNGFFIKDIRNVYDNNFNKLSLIGEAREFIDEIGYISYDTKFGLVDFTGKNIVENKFDYFYLMNSNTIEFIEFPVSFIQDSYNKGKIIKTVQKYISYSGQFAKNKYSIAYKLDREKSVHKKHIFNINERKLIQIKKIFNTNESTNYIFLSDYDEAKQFILAFEKIVMPLSTYGVYKDFFEFTTRNYNIIKKKEAAINLCKTYENKIKQDEITERKRQESCYIATMVYEDINHPQVEFLRQFRDNILIKSCFGKIFIKYYYQYSPSFVEKLKKHKKINYIIKKVLDLFVKLIK